MWSIVQQLSSAAGGAVTFLVLARLLDPRDFGVVALAAVVIAALGMFLDLGLGRALVQRPNISDGHINAVFITTTITAAFFLVLIYVSAPWIARALAAPEISPVLRWLALLFPLGALEAPGEALLIRRLAFRRLALRTAVAMVFSSAIGITLALRGAGPYSLVAQQLTAAAVAGLFVAIGSGWRPGFRATRREAREILSFGTRIVVGEALVFVERNCDNLLIGRFLGPVALGTYSVAYRAVFMANSVLVSSLSRVLLPAFSQVQEDRERFSKRLIEVVFGVSLLAFPLFGAAAILGDGVVLVLFGPKWTNAVTPFRLLSIGVLILAPVWINTPALQSRARPGTASLLLGVQSISAIAFFSIAILFDSISAVAVAFVARAALVSPLSVLTTCRVLHIPKGRYCAALAGPACCTALAVAVTLISQVAVRLPPLAELTLGLTVFGASYSLAARTGMRSEATRVMHTLRVTLSVAGRRSSS